MVHTAKHDPPHIVLELIRCFERRLDHRRVIERSRFPDDLLQGRFKAEAPPGTRLVTVKASSGISNGKNPRPVRNLVTLEPRGYPDPS